MPCRKNPRNVDPIFGKDRDAMLRRLARGTKVGAPEECWPWVAGLRRRGDGKLYGAMTDCPLSRGRAYRAAVIASGRDIPDGMTVDHVCRNTVCVNPNHLRVVSMADNLRWAIHRRSKSGFIGVGRTNPRFGGNRWHYALRVGGGKYVREYGFPSAEEAARARDAAAVRHHGEFAVLNFSGAI